MSGETLGERAKRLQGELDAANHHIAAINAANAAEKDSWNKMLWGERQMRAAAQRGLVPYVRSLERFDKWLRERPKLRAQLEPILSELGLWEIKLGYDPDQDLALSAISPRWKKL